MMEIPDNRKRLINHVEDLGRGQDDTRITLHRAIARMKSLDPARPGVAAIRKYLPVLLNFMTSESPGGANLFELRRLQMLCKGALLYLIKEKDFIPDAGQIGGLEDDAWVISTIAAEVKKQFPDAVAADGEGLSPEAKKEAEKQLMELAGQPCKNPDIITSSARELINTLDKNSEHEFIRSLIDHAAGFISYIAAFTMSDGYNSNEYCFRIATGALRYLLKENDIINDRIGPYGYLDDAYVLDIANELFEKNKPSI